MKGAKYTRQSFDSETKTITLCLNVIKTDTIMRAFIKKKKKKYKGP